MPCEYLHLGIIKKDNGEPSSTISCNVYAYCEDEAHQLGPFECKFDRESILDAFERLLPRISFSSILRGCIQRGSGASPHGNRPTY